jgi:hypothetical protein
MKGKKRKQPYFMRANHCFFFFFRMTKSLEKLQRKTEEGSSNLVNVLLGQTRLSSPETLKDKIEFFDETLNQSQKNAVEFALSSPEIALIHGPPGKAHCICILLRTHYSSTAIRSFSLIH